jgi:Ankyrin repeats (3 copies)/Ankyrin repeat
MSSIIERVRAAVQAGDLVNLRALVSQQDAHDNIDWALSEAAMVGCVESCRVLWEMLSPQGKQIYFASGRSYSYGYPVILVAINCGQLEIVRLFIEEFKWNINRKDMRGDTPLYYATVDSRIEICRYLLEKGANVNLGGMELGIENGPLWLAVRFGDTDIVRLLLQYGADPNLNRRPANEEDWTRQRCPRHTDYAIWNGCFEILSMLLQHGAYIGSHYRGCRGTSLNSLLANRRTSRETQLSICRILVQHAKDDHATATLMHASLKVAANRRRFDIEGCQILLEAGIEASTAILHRVFHFAIRARNVAVCQLLVREYHVDPFLHEEDDEDEDENEGEDEVADEEPDGVSPFVAAARQPDTSILEYFLGVWDERFASTGGKNSDGDYPIHVACCDPLVSIQAIQVLVNRDADSLAAVDGEEGLLPFHFAANWGASLDVIFYLLQHCPDALSHVGNAAAAASAAVGQRQLSTLDGDHTHGSASESTCTHDHLEVCGPSSKKSKTTH